MTAAARPRLSTIDIAKHALNFSIAHFTIFSATERENLHGHNFQVECSLTAPVNEDGLVFDYGIVKSIIRELCDRLDEHAVLPTQSPFLSIEETEEGVTARFADEEIVFLRRDVLLLPIRNTTVEELSHWFLNQMLTHPDLSSRELTELIVRVSSSPGQSGSASWRAT